MSDDHTFKLKDSGNEPTSEGIGMMEVNENGKPVYGMVNECDKTLGALKKEGGRFLDTEDIPKSLTKKK